MCSRSKPDYVNAAGIIHKASPFKIPVNTEKNNKCPKIVLLERGKSLKQHREFYRLEDKLRLPKVTSTYKNEMEGGTHSSTGMWELKANPFNRKNREPQLLSVTRHYTYMKCTHEDMTVSSFINNYNCFKNQCFVL